jgi:thiosulfate/3-mercaptopyruvate sulfurtransferase
MKKLFFSAALFASTSSFVAAGDPLVTPAWLKDNLNDPKLVLFHVGARPEFEKEHIRGAQLVLPQDLSIPRAEGALVLQLLSSDALQGKLQTLGVSDDSRVIVYFGSDWVTPATRVYFSIDAAGLGEQVSILDGGMPAWKAAAGAVTDEITAPHAPGKITVKARPDLVLGLDEVRAGLDAKSIDLIDARNTEFFDGRSAGSTPRAGHIPGARSIPFASFATEDLQMKPVAEVAALFKAAGVEPGDTVVSYCHIGQQATMVYFAAKRLGLNAKVYDGSWDEWSRKADLKVEPATVK